MNEAAIRQELARTWISKGDRRRLEKQLALLQSSPAAVPQRAASARPDASGAKIEGSAAFIRATEHALAILRPTKSWALASLVRQFREAGNLGVKEVGGYIQGGVYYVDDNMWRGDPKIYAASIAHEGFHMSRGGRAGTEEEKLAMGVTAQALRELGAPWSKIRAYEEMAKNPTHHIGWNSPGSAGAR